MIDYDEDGWKITLMFRFYGSVAVKACWFSLPSALLAFLFVLLDRLYPELRQGADMLDMTEGMIWTATTASITLVIGFRTNTAFRRFWEGTTLLHQMRGEW
eukprot:gnl/TRDRNA2_/TRDRNA2_92451_c0_seq1.p1 gnl/TRDRNA2_/TRDRNA2_92451_c0~~gnl/TRDRNA2_/TRDRNA2_92451_c0_seq1.p1  ORF type:complete len:101 (-),score=9.26 gnl/TRDRNA2_/TRDRNA2_92451_c0_seq1:20-322(-)